MPAFMPLRAQSGSLAISEPDAMKPNAGIWAAFGAAALFGLSTPLAKSLLTAISPLMLAGCLYAGSGIGLGIALLVRTRIARSRVAVPRGPSLLWLLAATLFGGAMGPNLLMHGLLITDAASASLILNFEGVFTALLAWFVFRENFDRRIFLGMMPIFAGGLCLSVAPAQIGGIKGPLLVAGACLCWAIDNNLTRKVSSSDAMLIAASKGLVAGLANIWLAISAGEHLPHALDMVKAASLGFVGYGLSLVLFVIALRNLGTARTGAYYSLAPFLGAVLALALGAPLTPFLLIAGALMGAGVWLHLTEKHSHAHRHDSMTHEHVHSHDLHHHHTHNASDPDGEPHLHAHTHEELEHEHEHFPDIHHQH